MSSSSSTSHRRITLTCAAIIIGVNLALSLPPAGAAPGTLTPLTISSVPFLLNAPIFIAIEEGYFTEQGIEVRLSFFRDPAQLWPALISVQLDVQAGGYSAGSMNAILQGAKIRIVADSGHAAPGDTSVAFMVRQDLIDSGRFRTLRDLRGMRIGLPSRGGIPEMFLSQILRNRAVLTSDDVQIQQLPVPLFADAFRAKTIDAGTVAEPFVSRLAVLGLARAVTTLHDVMPRAQYAIIAYGPNLLSRNPGLGQRFMNAYLRGVQRYQDGKTDRNVAILRKYINEEEALLRKMPWPFFNLDGHVNVESILQTQGWWVREKLLDRAVNPDQFLDTRFAKRAYQLLRTSR